MIERHISAPACFVSCGFWYGWVMEYPSVTVLESVKEVGNFISFQQKQIKQLVDEKADLRGLYGAAVDAKRECEKANVELQARLNEYAKKLEAAEQRVAAELTARQGNLDNFNAEKLKLGEQIDSLRSQIVINEKDISRLQHEKDQIENELNVCRRDLQGVCIDEKRIEGIKGELNESMKQTATWKKRAAELEGLLAETKQQAGYLQTRVDFLEGQVESYRKGVNAVVAPIQSQVVFSREKPAFSQLLGLSALKNLRHAYRSPHKDTVSSDIVDAVTNILEGLGFTFDQVD